MARPKRHYSDQDRAAALAVYDSLGDHKFRLREAARQVDVPTSTLREWVKHQDRAAPANVRTQERESLVNVYAEVAAIAVGLQREAVQYLATLPDDQRGKATLDNLDKLNRVGGTATDKVQLLTGQPTQRFATMPDSERQERAAELISLADERRRRAG